MRSRDRDRLRVLRATLGVIDDAEAVPAPTAAGPPGAVSLGVGSTDVPRHSLSELEVIGLVSAEVHERQRVVAELEASAPDRARRLRAEAEVLRAFPDG